MASDLDFVEFVVDHIADVGDITYRKMFGEYAVYCGGKIVALICDNRLLVKPTEAGRSFIGDVVEEPPYPGAKPAFLIEEHLEDTEWISNLVRITAQELPEPKPKKRRSPKRRRHA
jgi:TfoX/Sxy family transcriptional regulator of competence genes